MREIRKGDWTRGEIEILEPIRVYHNQFLDVYDDRVRFPGGNEGTYIRIEYPNDQSVAVLPLTRARKVAAIRTFRHGVRGWGYEVPKGGVSPGEDLEAAARRELLEETGLVCGALEPLGTYSDSPAIYGSLLTCYLALDCRRSSDPLPEQTEAISGVREFLPEELLGPEGRLDFTDALTELLVYRYLDWDRREGGARR